MQRLLNPADDDHTVRRLRGGRRKEGLLGDRASDVRASVRKWVEDRRRGCVGGRREHWVAGCAKMEGGPSGCRWRERNEHLCCYAQLPLRPVKRLL
ncbi:hypothetical protein SLA2020_414930 [Shorea laevis]